MTDTAPSLTSAEERAAFAARHLPWNFTLLVVEACAFFCGLAFFDSYTVLPLLLERLGASNQIVGLTQFVRVFGFTFPALFASHYIHGRVYHKSFLLKATGVGRIGVLTLPFMLWRFGVTNRPVALVWFLIVYAIFWAMDGGCAVSWFDIIAKALPERVRGRFFGAMQMGNGIVALAVGASVTGILGKKGFAYPLNFVLLAVGWSVGLIASQILLSLVREPAGVAEDAEQNEAKPTFTAYLRGAFPLLRRRPRLRHLVVTRLLLEGASMAAPFYVLFAERNLHAVGMAGVYVMAQSAGKIVTGPLWGGLSDRLGALTAFRAVTVTMASVPLIALLSAPVAGTAAPWMMLGVFFCLGGVQDGLWMVASTMLLESVEEAERPFAVGVSSLMQTPTALYGVVGGFVAQAFSYTTVFLAALGFALVGLFLALRFPGRSTLTPSAVS